MPSYSVVPLADRSSASRSWALAPRFPLGAVAKLGPLIDIFERHARLERCEFHGSLSPNPASGSFELKTSCSPFFVAAAPKEAPVDQKRAQEELDAWVNGLCADELGGLPQRFERPCPGQSARDSVLRQALGEEGFSCWQRESLGRELSSAAERPSAKSSPSPRAL